MVDGEEENKNQLDKSNEEQIPKISKNDLEKEDRDKCEKENTSDSVFTVKKALSVKWKSRKRNSWMV